MSAAIARACLFAASLLIWPPLAHGGFERVAVGTPPIVIYGAQPNSNALDCVGPGSACNGPVALAIALALKKSNVTIAEFFDVVVSNVVAITQGQQRPWMRAADNITVPLVSASGGSVALVVGNATYTKLPKLVGVTNDAKAVSASLREVGFRTEMIADLESNALNKAIDEVIQQAGLEDTVLVYYAGYGVAAGNENYVAGIDADASEPISSLLNVQAIIDKLSRSQAKNKILVLDTNFMKAWGGR